MPMLAAIRSCSFDRPFLLGASFAHSRCCSNRRGGNRYKYCNSECYLSQCLMFFWQVHRFFAARIFGMMLHVYPSPTHITKTSLTKKSTITWNETSIPYLFPFQSPDAQSCMNPILFGPSHFHPFAHPAGLITLAPLIRLKDCVYLEAARSRTQPFDWIDGAFFR